MQQLHTLHPSARKEDSSQPDETHWARLQESLRRLRQVPEEEPYDRHLPQHNCAVVDDRRGGRRPRGFERRHGPVLRRSTRGERRGDASRGERHGEPRPHIRGGVALRPHQARVQGGRGGVRRRGCRRGRRRGACGHGGHGGQDRPDPCQEGAQGGGGRIGERHYGADGRVAGAARHAACRHSGGQGRVGRGGGAGRAHGDCWADARARRAGRGRRGRLGGGRGRAGGAGRGRTHCGALRGVRRGQDGAQGGEGGAQIVLYILISYVCAFDVLCVASLCVKQKIIKRIMKTSNEK